jgi:hypothetical protein
VGHEHAADAVSGRPTGDIVAWQTTRDPDAGEGRNHLAIAAEWIDPGSAPLTDVGTVTFTNLDVVDNRAYAIAGIAPQRALALRLVDGRPIHRAAPDRASPHVQPEDPR